RVWPRVFLAPVFWRPVVVVAPAADALVWEDGETLSKDEEWTEFTLDVNDRGRALLIEIASGSVDLDFAEVVFDNGDTQVVDFEEKTHDHGVYSLLDFRDGRKVDHVRVVAKAGSDTARVNLKMVK